LGEKKKINKQINYCLGPAKNGEKRLGESDRKNPSRGRQKAAPFCKTSERKKKYTTRNKKKKKRGQSGHGPSCKKARGKKCSHKAQGKNLNKKKPVPVCSVSGWGEFDLGDRKS